MIGVALMARTSAAERRETLDCMRAQPTGRGGRRTWIMAPPTAVQTRSGTPARLTARPWVPSRRATGGRHAIGHPCAPLHLARRRGGHRAHVDHPGPDGGVNWRAHAVGDGPLVPDGDALASRGADARG